MSIELVAMRLADMTKWHPAQDNSRVCGKCGQPVGVYPSGQRILRLHPDVAIVCQVCVSKDKTPAECLPAAPMAEIAQESRDSIEIKKQ
jgi:hypothetical protein